MTTNPAAAQRDSNVAKSAGSPRSPWLNSTAGNGPPSLFGYQMVVRSWRPLRVKVSVRCATVKVRVGAVPVSGGASATAADADGAALAAGPATADLPTGRAPHP